MRRVLWVLGLPGTALGADLLHQVRLSDSNGAPLDGPIPVSVAIYADATPGAPDVACHTQSLGTVPFQSGYAALTLTNVSPTCATGDQWLAVTVGSPGVELAPRQKLASSLHAVRADVATTATHTTGYVDLFVDADFADGPACTVAGRIAYESSSSSLMVCDGTAWKRVGYDPGSSALTAVTSCKALKASYPSLPSDVYWLDPDGGGSAYTPFEAYCDQVTEGGGWTLVYKIADSSNMKTTSASNTSALLVDDITLATSGKFSDGVIRELYTEQYRTEQWGTSPYRTYCTLNNEANYADNTLSAKTCGISYSTSASYGTSVPANNWTHGLSDYTGGNGLIFQLNYGDSRLGCHIRSGGTNGTDSGCTSNGGCHCRAWVR
jgi:hypothetical protein